MDPWLLVYEGFDPQEEPLREALCTLGNGYFATRGALAQANAGGIHYPGTYLAGGYNRLETHIAGRVIVNEDLVNLPNWLVLTFRIDEDDWFDLQQVDLLSYRQTLDLKRGLLQRTIRFRDGKNRETRIEERRLVHMAEPHLAALELTISAENWSGILTIKSALDGLVVNSGVKRYRGLKNKHLRPLLTRPLGENGMLLKVQTNQSEIRIAQAARTAFFQEDEILKPQRSILSDQGYIAQHCRMQISEGEELRVEKIMAVHTSRDHASSECSIDAEETLARAGSFTDLLESHVLDWKNLWQRFEMAFVMEEEAKDGKTAMILHLNLFHLLQTTSMHTIDLDVGVPSRGWHGEAYRGHIFWDELFIFPLLNLRVPEITRSLLVYRYRRLNEARAAARAAGYKGAMYPWQSGSNGREESQQLHLNPESGRWIPDNSHRQRHVNAAIAYNIWQYDQVTGDQEFLSFCGAEMLLEIARFWASLITYNPESGRYEILGVMGPDEYHDGYPGAEEAGLKNNAYTNIMAVWVLREALRTLERLPRDRSEELCETLVLSRGERDLWQDITRRMCVVFHDDGIISQFEGYADLKEFDWEGYREKYGDIQRLDRILEAEDDTPNRYKASKQADVLMLFYLFSAEELGELFAGLGYDFDGDTIPRNIRYYMARTSHGSTLSRVVHSWVLARSDRVRSWNLFKEALKSDYTDIQGGTTPEGIHLGAMAGSVNLIQEAFTGIRAREDVLWFNPCLPEEMGSLDMRIRYRGHSLRTRITQNELTVEAVTVAAGPCSEEPIRIGFQDEIFRLHQGQSKTFQL